MDHNSFWSQSCLLAGLDLEPFLKLRKLVLFAKIFENIRTWRIVDLTGSVYSEFICHKTFSKTFEWKLALGSGAITHQHMNSCFLKAVSKKLDAALNWFSVFIGFSSDLFFEFVAFLLLDFLNRLVHQIMGDHLSDNGVFFGDLLDFVGSLYRCAIYESIFRLKSSLLTWIFNLDFNLDGRDNFSVFGLFADMCASFFQDELFEFDWIDVW